MNFAKARLNTLTLTVFSLTILSLTLWLPTASYASTTGVSATAPTGVSATVYVNDCGTPTVKPESLTQFCADAGVSIIHIRWSSWNAQGATGVATLAINSCDPYCAAGKYSLTPVKVRLTGLHIVKGVRYLQDVTLTVLPGKKLNIPKNMTSVPGGLRWSELGH